MVTPRQDSIIAGRYVLLRHLASGGMGSIWVARHRDLDIDVAVKLMCPALVVSPEARTRFEREAKVAARLHSQHVVQIHDYGVEEDTPYIVMEWLKGESLSERLMREGRLSVAATARLLIQMCKALSTAHEVGLVHRDLKPANIFLALMDDDEVVKVLDFGIVKAATPGVIPVTAQNMLLGSISYMSPEQIRCPREVDHRSDLWSVGVILYRALTGRLPFSGKSDVEVLLRVCSDISPPRASAASDLPPSLDDFFERAFAHDPTRRFQSALELVQAFCSLPMGVDAPSQQPSICRRGTTLPSTSMVQRSAMDADEATIEAPTSMWRPVPQRASASTATPAPEAQPRMAPSLRTLWPVWAAAVATFVVIAYFAIRSGTVFPGAGGGPAITVPTALSPAAELARSFSALTTSLRDSEASPPPSATAAPSTSVHSPHNVVAPVPPTTRTTSVRPVATETKKMIPNIESIQF
jgi:serine/threonine-protein kinase